MGTGPFRAASVPDARGCETVVLELEACHRSDVEGFAAAGGLVLGAASEIGADRFAEAVHLFLWKL